MKRIYAMWGLLLSVLVLSACEPVSRLRNAIEQQIENNTEEAIRNSPTLQEVDSVCRAVPLPRDFQLVRKGGLDDQKVTISYYYSSKTSYEKVQRLWRNYFEGNGWKFIKEDDFGSKSMEFQNERYRIVTYYGGMGNRSDYSIYCEKL